MGWGEVDRDKDNQEQLDKQMSIDRPRDQREELESHYQTFRSNETHVQRLERERREGRNRSRTERTPPRGRSGFTIPQAALLFVIFALGVGILKVALDGTIDSNFAEHEMARHFLRSWLALAVNVFLPITFLIVLICAFARAFWRGVQFVIAAGILSVVGTFIYLVLSGVFFGK